MIFKKDKLGWSIESNSHFVFFGNKLSLIENLRDQYPHFRFSRIKQVHGDKLVHSSKYSIDFSKEADAHYTEEKNLGLIVSTADCVPVLIFNQMKSNIIAIHAGWRGVLNRIIPKSIQSMCKEPTEIENLKIYIGPHIGFQSFEIEDHIRNQLLNTCQKSQKDSFQPSQPGKSLVNLLSIVQGQMNDLGVDNTQIQALSEDTKTSSDLHSYRRDLENSGRQLSFIALK